MKNLKRIMVFIFVVLLLSTNLPLYASANIVASETEQATACLPVIQIFGQSHNVQYIFDAETTAENISMLLDLWSQYTSEVNNAITMNQMYNQIITDNTYLINEAGYLTFNISANLAGLLTQFWDYVLSGPAQMVQVDNQYAWTPDQTTGQVSPIPVKVLGSLIINGKELILTDKIVVDIYSGSSSNPTHYYTESWKFNQPVYAYTAFQQPSSSYRNVVILYDIPFSYSLTREYYNGSSNQYFTGFSSELNSSSYGDYQYYTLGSYSIQANGSVVEINDIWSPLIDLPYYYNLDDRRADPSAIFGSPANADMSSTENSIKIKPYDDTTGITLPSTSDTPVPVSIISDYIPSVEAIEDDADLKAAAQDASDAIFDDNFGIQQDTPTPPAANEVFTPLLPIQLPSFNFSFSGIWHYVREWVGSISSWLSVMFTVWSHLPYAITVPVYATAVIVIVLGVYKRFFM